MVARNRKTASQHSTAPTRELFSDSISHAETQTTNPPRPVVTGTPPYLDRRPVKFINVRVGSRFLLNGGTWKKIDYDQATNFIPMGDREIAGATCRILPADLVFVLSEPETVPETFQQGGKLP